MTQLIKIKRSTSTAAPTSLENGEIAYSSSSDKLFIGRPGGSTGDIDAIGGKFFTDLLDHTAGTVTASSALIVDSDSKLDVLNVDNLTFNGNSITSTDLNGNILITPNGGGSIVLDAQSWPQADGTANYVLQTNGSGQLSWVSRLANILEDTTPQLGGDLDLNGNDLVTTSNADISLDPNGTGGVILAGNATRGSGKLTFNCEVNTHGVTVQGPAHSAAATYTLTLPTSAGSADQVLKTNGSGVLSWTNVVSDLSEDTTPQLGGDLDVNGNSIVSASNGDIAITPNGTGSIVLDGQSWPQADGTADYYLKTNGAGQLSWAAVSSGGLGNVSEDTTPQLGGDLDVNGNSIVSASAGNIEITPDTTGSIVLDGQNWPQADGSNGQYLGTNGSGQLSWNTIFFTIDGDTGSANAINNGETVSIVGTSNEIETAVTANQIQVGLPDNVTVGNNLTVTGNLTVSGTTTTVNSTTVTVDDPIFTLGGDSAPASDDNKDRGIEFNWHDGTNAKVGFFGFDDSTSKFTFISDATNTSEVFSGNAGDVSFGSLDLAGSITSVDGSAPTDGQLLIGNTSNGDMELSTLTAGSNGVSITNAAGAVTIENSLATTSSVGVASFDSTQFSVTSGAVEIATIDGGTFS